MDDLPARLRGASKRYDDIVALDRLDLELHAGEKVVN